MIVTDLAEWYEEHHESLVRFAASLVGPHHADDLVGGAVLGVVARGTVDIDDLRAYLYRSVTNGAARHWRTIDRRQRREAAVVALTPGAGSSVPDHADLLADEAIVAALAGLSVQQRAVVHLTYWEDLTSAAVARRLSVSEGTVRRQLARARHRLRSSIDA